MTQTVFKFKLERSDEEITPYGGLGIYGELYHALGIGKEIKKKLPGPGSGAGYEANSYVCLIVMMKMAGGRTMEDIRKIETDRAVRRICGIKETPSSDAIGDWLRREFKKKVEGLKKVHRKLSLRMLKLCKEKELTLDIDATEIVAEKYEAKVDYKGNKGYMPMLGFIPELDWCAGYEFREGNESPGSRNAEFAIETVKFVRGAGKRIARFRSDSAAYQARVLNEMNREEVRYTITVDKDIAVVGEIARISEDAWKRLKDRDGISTDREVAEFIHSMNETDHAFRVVVQRWKNPQRELFGDVEEYCYYGIATNYDEEEMNWEKVIHWHNGRGNSENYNKELKNGFRMEYMPSGEYGANAVWFGLGILAYDLFVISKKHVFGEGWLHKTIETVRWQVIELAGKVVRRSRSVILKLCGVGQEIYETIVRARQRCWELKTVL